MKMGAFRPPGGGGDYWFLSEINKIVLSGL